MRSEQIARAHLDDDVVNGPVLSHVHIFLDSGEHYHEIGVVMKHAVVVIESNLDKGAAKRLFSNLIKPGAVIVDGYSVVTGATV